MYQKSLATVGGGPGLLAYTLLLARSTVVAPAILFVLQPLATPEQIRFLSRGTQMLPPEPAYPTALHLRAAAARKKQDLFLGAPSLRSPHNEHESMVV